MQKAWPLWSLSCGLYRQRKAVNIASLQNRATYELKGGDHETSTIARTFVIAGLMALALGSAPDAKAENKGCSNATLKGSFAYSMTGFITAPAAPAGPFAEVGTQTFDGKGNTTATAMLSQNNGNIIPVTITGTFEIQPDPHGLQRPIAGWPLEGRRREHHSDATGRSPRDDQSGVPDDTAFSTPNVVLVLLHRRVER
jgi:hypothetical protein